MLNIITLACGVAAYMILFFFPNAPFNQTILVSVVLTILMLFGIVPYARFRGIATWGDLIRKKEFWLMVAGLGNAVLVYFFPNVNIGVPIIYGIIVLILGIWSIEPTFRARQEAQKWNKRVR